MNPDEFTVALAYVRRIWPQQRLPERTADAWFRLLGDLDADALTAAIEDLATSGREFPPSAGHLRKRACELVAPGVPDADEAWDEVNSAMARVGSYGTPTWSHPAVSAAVETIGWRKLCLSENSMADRAHFIGFYGTIRDRTQRDLAMPPAVREMLQRVAERHALTAADDAEPRAIGA